ncbi:MAG: hypothetical protein RLZZ603_907 [Actinomycetota bacterium]|jgi:hypothetical protein
MFQPLIEVAFLLIFAALMAAVTPYVTGEGEKHGVLLPGAFALSVGAVVWSLLTWLGMADTDGWIWSITMVLMPVGMGFGLKYYVRAREAGKLGFVDDLAKAIDGAASSNTNEELKTA